MVRPKRRLSNEYEEMLEWKNWQRKEKKEVYLSEIGLVLWLGEYSWL